MAVHTSEGNITRPLFAIFAAWREITLTAYSSVPSRQVQNGLGRLQELVLPPNPFAKVRSTLRLMTQLEWKGGLVLEATTGSGAQMTFDAAAGFGGSGRGPTPLEAMAAATAACTAMDVLSILEKKRQKVAGYSLEVHSERAPEGEWPRPIVSMKITHRLEGPDLDPEAVARAVQLSDEKYCSAVATLRTSVKVEMEWAIGGLQ